MPKLILAHTDTDTTILGYLDGEGRLYSYEPQPDLFYRNDGLYQDYFLDRTAHYKEIDPASAKEWIARLPETARSSPPAWPPDRETTLDPAFVLGGYTVPNDSPRRHARRAAEAAITDGGWIAYRVYPAAKADTAHAAAYQIRNGKVKALSPDYDAQAARNDDGSYTVSVRHRPR